MRNVLETDIWETIIVNTSNGHLQLQPNVLRSLYRLQQMGYSLVLLNGEKPVPANLQEVLTSEQIIHGTQPHSGDGAVYYIGKSAEGLSITIGEFVGANIPTSATDWNNLCDILKPKRIASIQRTTKETDIFIELNLDGTGQSNISTGVGFYDHMLDQVARHSGCDLVIKATGDLHIDEHHTVEDTAIALGECFLKALGDKKGIERYGWYLPMDDSLAHVGIDFGGRPWLVWDAEFKREMIGSMPTELFYHFFKSFSDAARCNLNIKCEGDNEHHKIEAIFKAFAKSIKMAVKQDPNNQILPSTKGVL